MILSLLDFYKHRIKKNGFKYLISFTDSGYPRILSFGYYSKEGIVVAKVGDWKLRYMHELGHQFGYEHESRKCIMNPYGFKRTWDKGLISKKDFILMIIELNKIDE